VASAGAPYGAVLAVHIISTLYLFTWDIVMDWGLRLRLGPDFLYRHRMHYPKSFYYFAAVTNLILRFSWEYVFAI
jgi:hypothetical protein